MKALFKILFLFLPFFGMAQTRGYFRALNVTASVGGSYDTDAQALFTQIEVNDPSPTSLSTTIKDAYNTLVVGVKANGMWTNMKAFYPFIGGTAASHKYNGKDPRDLDAAYRITWTASPTHSSNGVAFNGSTQYGDTHFLPSSGLSAASTGVLGYYSRTQVLADQVEIGAFDGVNDFFLALYFSSTSGTRTAMNGTTRYNSNTQTSTTGLFTAVRDDGTNISVYRNGSLLAQQAAASGSLESSYTVWLGGGNTTGSLFGPSTKQCAFAFIYNGTLTSTQAATLYTLIQDFETALSRNV